jgi:hypothetical protein
MMLDGTVLLVAMMDSYAVFRLGEVRVGLSARGVYGLEKGPMRVRAFFEAGLLDNLVAILLELRPTNLRRASMRRMGLAGSAAVHGVTPKDSREIWILPLQ